jgi:hypothetical protein
MLTTQKQVRESFWQAHPQFINERRSRKTQNDYRTDIRVSFTDHVDHLMKDGQISESLAYKVTL